MFLAPSLQPKTLEQLEKKSTNDVCLRQQEDLFLEQVDYQVSLKPVACMTKCSTLRSP